MSRLSDYFQVGKLYTPAMMEYDGSTGYYSDATFTSTSSNLFTLVFRMKRSSFTGDTYETLSRISRTGGSRFGAYITSSDWSTDTEIQGRVQVWINNSVGSNVVSVSSVMPVCDGDVHTVFMAFDADNGTLVFKIDGVDADNTGWTNRVAPTTGTLDTGASETFWVGCNFGATQLYGGEMGFFGYSETYQTNWSDFMDTNGNPKPLDESGWTEWGAQPLFWNEHGEMTNNLGSLGNMTANGTIVVGKGGN